MQTDKNYNNRWQLFNCLNRFKQLNSKTKPKKTPPSNKHIKLEDLNIGVSASSEPALLTALFLTEAKYLVVGSIAGLFG